MLQKSVTLHIVYLLKYLTVWGQQGELLVTHTDTEKTQAQSYFSFKQYNVVHLK